MLRTVWYGRSMPASFVVDPSAEFQPGMIAELNVVGNQVVATVSTGICPIGVIDEVKTRAFTRNVWNETIIVSVPSTTGPGGVLVSAIDVKAELKKPNILASSFVTTVDCVLNEVNGVITFLAGTPLNLDLTGSGYPNAIKAVVNYTYTVANVPGDDSTIGSGRVTVWYDRFFFQTDQFETNQLYPVRANLYVSESGILTTRRPSDKHPAVATVTAPPVPMHPMLECMWY